MPKSSYASLESLIDSPAMNKLLSITFLILLPASVFHIAVAQTARANQLTLTQNQASHFAGLAMKCVQKEYPNKLDHVNNDAEDVRSPKVLHPAFYGCFDWHSTVHGHWMLVQLLRLFPEMPEARQIRKALDANLSAKFLPQPAQVRAVVAVMMADAADSNLGLLTRGQIATQHPPIPLHVLPGIDRQNLIPPNEVNRGELRMHRGVARLLQLPHGRRR